MLVRCHLVAVTDVVLAVAVHFWCLFSIIEQCQDYTVLGIVLVCLTLGVTVQVLRVCCCGNSCGESVTKGSGK